MAAYLARFRSRSERSNLTLTPSRGLSLGLGRCLFGRSLGFARRLRRLLRRLPNADPVPLGIQEPRDGSHSARELHRLHRPASPGSFDFLQMLVQIIDVDV